ncbi:RidA family protein [Streptomyces fractus]|uniref:RidA family protein n=1 Tax=Streptomyces fractus TaxID=641806 RepID=UPI003CEA1005
MRGTPEIRPTEFVLGPKADHEMMAKYGLGGAAKVGNAMFAGGMAINLEGLSRVPEAVTIADETRLCFERVGGILGQAGGRLEDIVKITAYVSDQEYTTEMWRTVDEILPARPKRITLGAGIAGDCRVEFEVMAVLENGEAS